MLLLDYKGRPFPDQIEYAVPLFMVDPYIQVIHFLPIISSRRYSCSITKALLISIIVPSFSEVTAIGWVWHEILWRTTLLTGAGLSPLFYALIFRAGGVCLLSATCLCVFLPFPPGCGGIVLILLLLACAGLYQQSYLQSKELFLYHPTRRTL